MLLRILPVRVECVQIFYFGGGSCTRGSRVGLLLIYSYQGSGWHSSPSSLSATGSSD